MHERSGNSGNPMASRGNSSQVLLESYGIKSVTLPEASVGRILTALFKRRCRASRCRRLKATMPRLDTHTPSRSILVEIKDRTISRMTRMKPPAENRDGGAKVHEVIPRRASLPPVGSRCGRCSFCSLSSTTSTRSRCAPRRWATV